MDVVSECNVPTVVVLPFHFIPVIPKLLQFSTQVAIKNNLS